MELQFCLNIDSSAVMATFVSIPIQRVGTGDFVKTSSERQIPIEVESDIAGSQVKQSVRGRSADITYETFAITDDSSTSSGRPAMMERKPPPGKPPRTAPMPRRSKTVAFVRPVINNDEESESGYESIPRTPDDDRMFITPDREVSWDQLRRWREEVEGRMIQDQDGWCHPPENPPTLQPRGPPPQSPPLPPKNRVYKAHLPPPQSLGGPRSSCPPPDWGLSEAGSACSPRVPRRRSSLMRSCSLPGGVSPFRKGQEREAEQEEGRPLVPCLKPRDRSRSITKSVRIREPSPSDRVLEEEEGFSRDSDQSSTSEKEQQEHRLDSPKCDELFEWVEFKQHEGLPSGVILPPKESTDIDRSRESSSDSTESFQSAVQEQVQTVDVGTQTDEVKESLCSIM